MISNMTNNRSLPSVAIALLSTLAILVAHADSNPIEQRRILPYLEAEGQANARNLQVRWVDPDKVVYQTSLEYKDNSIENYPDRGIIHIDQQGQVQIFDTITKKSEFHQKGHLRSFEDGIATIVLTETISKSSSVESYDELLKGPLGEEVPITLYHSKVVKLQKLCPMDNETSAPERTSIRLLRAEHGCIRVPYPFNNNSDPHTYFRSDGQKMNLPIPAGDQIGFGFWIDWLKAYLLGDNVTVSIGRTAGVPKNTPTIKLFYPTGELKLIEMGEYSLTHARPTRAGMVAAKNRPDNGTFVTQVNGLFLWRDGQQYQITEGNVTKSEVSPDGCKVAFYAEHKNLLSRGRTAKLRVIDVCEGFGVAKDANPFEGNVNGVENVNKLRLNKFNIL
jgi:hypothetical protein